MKRIGLTASEEISFENVDRRTDGRTDDGRTDTFIYFGSGELITNVYIPKRIDLNKQAVKGTVPFSAVFFRPIFLMCIMLICIISYALYRSF